MFLDHFTCKTRNDNYQMLDGTKAMEWLFSANFSDHYMKDDYQEFLQEVFQCILQIEQDHPTQQAREIIKRAGQVGESF